MELFSIRIQRTFQLVSTAICGIPKPLPSKKPDSDRRKEAGGGSPQKGQSDTIKKLTCYTLVRVK